VSIAGTVQSQRGMVLSVKQMGFETGQPWKVCRRSVQSDCSRHEQQHLERLSHWW